MRPIHSLSLVAFLFTCAVPVAASARLIRYGDILCGQPEYRCITTKNGDSWETLFPDEGVRDMVKRINRRLNRLWANMKVAVPRELAGKTIMDFAPFETKIAAPRERMIVVSPRVLAWGAYEPDGTLVRWGPISAGRQNETPTKVGAFRIRSLRSRNARSNLYPVGCKGLECAWIPWFMEFHNGQGLHGYKSLPGYNNSHGCVRLFIEDAEWLNQKFARIGTKLIVEPYEN